MINTVKKIEEKLLEKLDLISNITPEKLEQLIKEFNFNLRDLITYLNPPECKPYGRKIIYKSEQIECLLMTWGINRKCQIHSHGSQTCGFIKVMKGTVANYNYKKGCDNSLIQISSNIYSTGDLFFVPSGILHQMHSITQEQLITLHFYVPPITSMKIYDVTHNLVFQVTDDCGAWFPEENQIVSVKNLQN